MYDFVFVLVELSVLLQRNEVHAERLLDASLNSGDKIVRGKGIDRMLEFCRWCFARDEVLLFLFSVLLLSLSVSSAHHYHCWTLVVFSLLLSELSALCLQVRWKGEQNGKCCCCQLHAVGKRRWPVCN